jgi:hypothetical protein
MSSGFGSFRSGVGSCALLVFILATLIALAIRATFD